MNLTNALNRAGQSAAVSGAIMRNFSALIAAAQARRDGEMRWFIHNGFTFMTVLQDFPRNKNERYILPSWMLVLTGCPKTDITTDSTNTPPGVGSPSASAITVNLRVDTCQVQSTLDAFQHSLHSLRSRHAA